MASGAALASGSVREDQSLLFSRAWNLSTAGLVCALLLSHQTFGGPACLCPRVLPPTPPAAGSCCAVLRIGPGVPWGFFLSPAWLTGVSKCTCASGMCLEGISFGSPALSPSHLDSTVKEEDSHKQCQIYFTLSCFCHHSKAPFMPQGK